MTKKMNTRLPQTSSTEEPLQTPFETEDAILAGILKSVGVELSPLVRESGKIAYRAKNGALEGLQRIYRNEPIGSLDALNNVKAARSAIYALKSGGQRL